jgi:hypothetical protein
VNTGLIPSAIRATEPMEAGGHTDMSTLEEQTNKDPQTEPATTAVTVEPTIVEPAAVTKAPAEPIEPAAVTKAPAEPIVTTPVTETATETVVTDSAPAGDAAVTDAPPTEAPQAPQPGGPGTGGRPDQGGANGPDRGRGPDGG